MPVTKPLQMVPRGSQLYPAQQADVYYQDPRGAAPPFEPAPYQQGDDLQLTLFLFLELTVQSNKYIFNTLVGQMTTFIYLKE